MAFCRNCGFQVADTSTFCPNCGNSMQAAAPEAAPVMEQPVAYAQPQAPAYAQPPVQGYDQTQMYAQPPVQAYDQTQMYAQPPVQAYAQPEAAAPAGGGGLAVFSMITGILNLLPALILSGLLAVASLVGAFAYETVERTVGEGTMQAVQQVRDEYNPSINLQTGEVTLNDNDDTTDLDDIGDLGKTCYGISFGVSVLTIVLAVMGRVKGSKGAAQKTGLILGIVEVVCCVLAGLSMLLYTFVVG